MTGPPGSAGDAVAVKPAAVWPAMNVRVAGEKVIPAALGVIETPTGGDADRVIVRVGDVLPAAMLG